MNNHNAVVIGSWGDFRRARYAKGQRPDAKRSNLEQVKTYIRNQKQHQKKLTFEEEFVAMLKKAGVDYVFG